MRTVLATFADWGIDDVKADFLAGGAVPGPRHNGSDPVTVYRTGLGLIREAIGRGAHLLGCAAPTLPSFRVSADTGLSTTSVK